MYGGDGGGDGGEQVTFVGYGRARDEELEMEELECDKYTSNTVDTLL